MTAKGFFLTLAISIFALNSYAQDSTATKVSVKGRVFNITGSGASSGGGSADGNDYLTTASLTGESASFSIQNQASVNLDLSPFALDSDLANLAKVDQVNTFTARNDFNSVVVFNNIGTYAFNMSFAQPGTSLDFYSIQNSGNNNAFNRGLSFLATIDGTSGAGEADKHYYLNITGNAENDQDLTPKKYVDAKTDGFKTNIPVALASSSGQVSPLGNDTNIYTITLTEDSTINNPSSPVTGSIYQFIVQQDATGLHTLSWGNQFAFPDGISPVMTLDPGAVDVYTAYWNGTIFITTYVQNFLTP